MSFGILWAAVEPSRSCLARREWRDAGGFTGPGGNRTRTSLSRPRILSPVLRFPWVPVK